MSKNSDHVKRWRKAMKARMIRAMGGKCVCCGYNKCNEALDFHHINPAEKEFSFNRVRGNPKSWILIVKELRKCVLVCANCHREIEFGFKLLPDIFSSFDERFTNYEEEREPFKRPCNGCPNLLETFSKSLRYCSTCRP